MFYRLVISLLFFLSGLSALIYQVLWVRSFSLIFGGSHLAVTTVLGVFMGGLALGGFLGRHADRSSRPMKVYGFLEIGIGLAAFALLGVFQIYPDLYVAFARLVGGQSTVLLIGRIVFSVVALLVPTTLMGLTLPTLAGFAARQQGSFGRHLSFLYGINTLGAVAGALAAGFFLLGHLTVNATYGLAIVISLAVGVVSLLLDSSFAKSVDSQQPIASLSSGSETVETQGSGKGGEIPVRLILVGIGISGFCALGYEILWTRVLSIVVGTTVYGYTLMLVAFLTGIAAGGASYRFLLRYLGSSGQNIGRAVFSFGAVQAVIGLLALVVSHALRDLPRQAIQVEAVLGQWFGNGLNILQTTNFILALVYMVVPAFFMGLAFPLAADIVAQARGKVGKAVGETLTYNTVGAILGATVSGFVLIYLFGIERSLQYLSLLNLGLGLMVGARFFRSRFVSWGFATAVAIFMVYLSVAPDAFRIWDKKYFAVFNHNARQVFSTEDDLAALLESTEVLYYAEGTTSTISVIKVRGDNQGVNVNGRTVASTAKQDRQCQYTLGHLPMLLHPKPKKVWVLGMGTGMTAGATSVHPGVESVTVVELEKHVPPAARTFAAYNHNFLDNPIVQVVFNDGRNYLLTTEERYDVITADPIHPWSQGAAYLYTDEYYRLAASRLRSGGIMCQWLPIYELNPTDLQSVVKTFSNNFKYVYVWLSDYDAELIGSNDKIEINIEALQRRLEASPKVLSDLQSVDMGSAADLLSYCIMGPAASRTYGDHAPLNTDNNLYLEFSAPQSKGKAELVAVNITDLSGHREDISPYLTGSALHQALGTDPAGLQQASEVYDLAHQWHYQGRDNQTGYGNLMSTLETRFPWYAPGRFLLEEYRVFLSRLPRLYKETNLVLLDQAGAPVEVVLSVVTVKISPERGQLLIVDNRERKIYGSVYIDGKADEVERLVAEKAERILELIGAVYQKEKATGGYPAASETLRKVQTAIDSFGS